MKLKFIQINIYHGKYLADLVKFIKAEQPDFVSMQEVTGGKLNLVYKTGNLVEILKKELSMEAIFNPDIVLSDDPSSFWGNAVFSRHEIAEKKVKILKAFETIREPEIRDENLFDKRPRHILDGRVKIGDFYMHILSWHGAWNAPPHDTEETLRQATLACEYIKSLDEPFILGCDLNATAEQETVKMVGEVAKNWIIGQNVVQTTHPTVHKIAPRGYLVDYIFTSFDFKLVSFGVPQILVSDHLPVVAEFEI